MNTGLWSYRPEHNKISRRRFKRGILEQGRVVGWEACLLRNGKIILDSCIRRSQRRITQTVDTIREVITTVIVRKAH